jgi:sRNA-binding regulator protein Hfq
MRDQRPITLYLWNGQVVAGTVKWWDLGAIELETADGELVVVQRHAAERWDPRAAENTQIADAEDELECPNRGGVKVSHRPPLRHLTQP